MKSVVIVGRGAPRAFGVVVSACALVALSAGTAAATDIFSTGFEPSTYAVGALGGQDGWGNAPGGATVQTGTVYAGSQAAQYDATGLSGQATAVHLAAYNSAGNPEQVVRVTGRFYVSSTGLATTGWTLSGTFGNAGFIGQLILIGDSVVTLGLASSIVGSVPITRGTWHTFEHVMDYSTGIQSASVNGTFVGDGPFASPSTTLAIYGFGLNTPSGGTDQLSLDDLSITSIPTPGPLAVLGLGGMIAARRRRGR